ncbi:ubiquinol-cytochrome-c reductase complex assembly factor 4 [Solea solea]|uniref:ubiquinol-cytochrome-c reductase complex assembly factor 4 n=1 Tax=Solea solea TaxID=90069 RepID=UPI00272A00B4|nr:ubiquinol-cytochrome-c reductase complex assembly factor 4 [Solea solea]
MFAIGGRVFTGLKQVSFSRGSFIPDCGVRLNSMRLLALSFRRTATSKKPTDEEEKNEPIKFSTSKASYKTWKVDQSMGSKYGQPLFKVLTVSLLSLSLILWCVLREETVIDGKLETRLYEHVPGLLSDQQIKEVDSKRSN